MSLIEVGILVVQLCILARLERLARTRLAEDEQLRGAVRQNTKDIAELRRLFDEERRVRLSAEDIRSSATSIVEAVGRLMPALTNLTKRVETLEGRR